MALDYSVKSLKDAFFTGDRVKKLLSTFERKALSKFGAFTRQRAKTSIVKAPKVDVKTGKITQKRKGLELKPAVSKPGDPPYSHEGSLRRLILFAYDPDEHVVVVGPVKFKGGNAPKLLEHGGVATKKGGRPALYRPRPFMRPAGDEEVRRFPLILRSLGA